jgi:excisionase family DNA binding protein
MNKHRETLSVTQAAVLCGVGRTTVGYWIRSKKLRAGRTGKKYQIPVQDLLYFLKAEGQEIPVQLEKQNLNQPVFRTFQNCWRHFQDHSHGLNCEQCIVFKNRLQICFSARNSGKLSCLGHCETCSYYQDTYYPRLQFIHQFDTPAAVVKDLYFWAGNLEMAKPEWGLNRSCIRVRWNVSFPVLKKRPWEIRTFQQRVAYISKTINSNR